MMEISQKFLRKIAARGNFPYLPPPQVTPLHVYIEFFLAKGGRGAVLMSR